jgi:hypothetical protein
MLQWRLKERCRDTEKAAQALFNPKKLKPWAVLKPLVSQYFVQPARMSGTEIQDKLPVPRGLDTSSLRRGHRQAIYGELSTKGKTTVVNIGTIIII